MIPHPQAICHSEKGRSTSEDPYEGREAQIAVNGIVSVAEVIAIPFEHISGSYKKHDPSQHGSAVQDDTEV